MKKTKSLCTACRTPQYVHKFGACVACNTGLKRVKTDK